jgi:hypothetical protein
MEILIATIILGMSMGVVFFSLKNIEETRCIADLKGSTVALQNAMLVVAFGSPPTTKRVAFKMPTCGDKSVEAVRFVYYKQRELCRLCPGQYEGCWVIEPTVYDFVQKKLYRLEDAAVCVQMPADISIEAVISPECLGSQMTDTPCPQNLPDGTTCKIKETAGFASPIYDPISTRSASVWQTFGRKQGDPRTFIFELSKAVTPGLSGSIRVCPMVK